MKFFNTRIFLVLLVSVSLCSYVYLSIAKCNNQSALTQVETVEEVEEKEMYLPDVALIKRVLETSKKLMGQVSKF